MKQVTTAAMFSIALLVRPVVAQDLVFDAKGFQQNRDYFSHGETEYVDTMSGHFVLRNVDLALPSNRRSVLRVGRVFSGGGWNMGLLDTVIEASTDLQAGGSGAAYLKTGDGAVHYARWIAPAPYNAAGCTTGCRFRWTNDFWLLTDRSAPSPVK